MDYDKTLHDLSPEERLAQYDRAAQELLDVALSDGHFEQPQQWPASQDCTLDGYRHRAALINHIHDGIPSRREQRLGEAHSLYQQKLAPYYRANRLFLALRRDFVAQS